MDFYLWVGCWFYSRNNRYANKRLPKFCPARHLRNTLLADYILGVWFYFNEKNWINNWDWLSVGKNAVIKSIIRINLCA